MSRRRYDYDDVVILIGMGVDAALVASGNATVDRGAIISDVLKKLFARDERLRREKQARRHDTVCPTCGGVPSARGCADCGKGS